MDALSRGSCTPKIPRTLANGELTMYLLQLLVRVSIDGSTGNVDHHLHRHLEGQLINAERHIQRDDSRFSKFLFEQLATFSISRRVNGSVKSDVALKGENRFRTSTDVL